MVVTRYDLDDESDEPSQEGRYQKRPNRPDKDLTAHNDATQIHILRLLLLLARSQKPALLGLVQRPRKRCPVEILQIPAPIVVSGGIRGIDLQRAAPRIPTVHTHLENRI